MIPGYELGGYGTCRGDSGAPLVFYQAEGNAEDDHYVQLGILHGSAKSQCSDKNYPSVFARLEDSEIWSFVMNQTYFFDEGTRNMLWYLNIGMEY